MKTKVSSKSIHASIIKMHQDLLKYIKENKPGDMPKFIKDKINFNKLQQVLRANWNENKEVVPTSPLYQFYGVKDLKINSKVVKGEIQACNDIFLIMNEKLPFRWNSVEEMENTCTDNYLKFEYRNLFNAWGRALTAGSGQRRYDRALEYRDKKRIWDVNYDILAQVVSLMIPIFGSNVTPINSDVSLKSMYFTKKGPANGGIPYVTRDNVMVNGVKAQTLYLQLSKELEKFKDPKIWSSIPAVLFQRNSTKGFIGHVKNNRLYIEKFNDSSARVIYGLSALVNMYLAKLAKPKIEAAKDKPAMIVLQGPSGVKKYLESLIPFVEKYKLFPVNVDISRFDISVTPQLMCIPALIDILVANTSKTVDITLSALLADVYTPMYISDTKGDIFTLKTFGGHKSGHVDTLLWGSEMNYFAILYCLLEIDYHYYLKLISILRSNGKDLISVAGDDGLILLKSKDHYSKLVKLMDEHFSFKMSESKFGEGLEFVQYYVDKNVTTYPIARAWRSILYPESEWAYGPCMLTLRNWMIIENVIGSPFFEKFVNLVYKIDSYKLGRHWKSPQGFMNALREEVQGINSKLPDSKKFKPNTLDDGRPSSSSPFEESGQVKSSWVQAMWNLIFKIVR